MLKNWSAVAYAKLQNNISKESNVRNVFIQARYGLSLAIIHRLNDLQIHVLVVSIQTKALITYAYKLGHATAKLQII